MQGFLRCLRIRVESRGAGPGTAFQVPTLLFNNNSIEKASMHTYHQNKYITPTPFQKVQNQSEIKTNLYQNSSGRLKDKASSFWTYQFQLAFAQRTKFCWMTPKEFKLISLYCMFLAKEMWT